MGLSFWISRAASVQVTAGHCADSRRRIDSKINECKLRGDFKARLRVEVSEDRSDLLCYGLFGGSA
jgi:hypothetical protein